MNIKKIVEHLIDTFLKAGDLSIALRESESSPADINVSINLSTIIFISILSLFNSF